MDGGEEEGRSLEVKQKESGKVENEFAFIIKASAWMFDNTKGGGCGLVRCHVEMEGEKAHLNSLRW